MSDTNLSDRLQQARSFAQRGEGDRAVDAYKQILATTDDKNALAEGYNFLGSWHGHFGRHEDAIDCYEKCIEIHPDYPGFAFDLALNYEKSGVTDKALPLYLKAISMQPQNARPYLYAGDLLARVGKTDEAANVLSLGADVDEKIRTAHSHPDADDELRQKSRNADNLLRKHFSQLHRSSVGAGDDVKRVHDCIWVQTHDGQFTYKNEQQKPHMFYTPDIPADPIHKNLDWVGPIEASWETIREEYIAAQNKLTTHPYVNRDESLGREWNSLMGSKDWKSSHLYQGGKNNEETSRHFSKTLALLENAPLVRMNDIPLEVFFSVLAPGTHIPPHFGLANCKMTVHLPIISSQECAVRVANETTPSTEGKIFAFDDSFVHEAWNKGTAPRVVLIFEAWAPALTEVERKAISNCFSVRNDWLLNRKLPTNDPV